MVRSRDAAAAEAAPTPPRPVTAAAATPSGIIASPWRLVRVPISDYSNVSGAVINPTTASGFTHSSHECLVGRFDEVRTVISEFESGQFRNSAEILVKRDKFLSAVYRVAHIISYTHPYEEDPDTEEEDLPTAISENRRHPVNAIHTMEELQHYWVPERVGQALAAIEFRTTPFDIAYSALGTEIRGIVARALGLFMPYQLRRKRYFYALSCHLSLRFHERIRSSTGCDDLTAMRFLLLLTMKVYAVLMKLAISDIVNQDNWVFD